MTAGVMAGEGGTEDTGDGDSVTHIRWERVATSLATVCARVLCGVTWKTGYESLPSFIPRSERMTEMKCMQDESNRGSAEVSVVSCIWMCQWYSNGIRTSRRY